MQKSLLDDTVRIAIMRDENDLPCSATRKLLFKTTLQSETKPSMMRDMEAVAKARQPRNITIHRGDARELDWIPDGSVHLIVTSPPYWTLKRYPENDLQLGHIADYERFHDELDRVWTHCLRVLVPGGRVVCVVGDVCLSRRKHGRHVLCQCTRT